MDINELKCSFLADVNKEYMNGLRKLIEEYCVIQSNASKSVKSEWFGHVFALKERVELMKIVCTYENDQQFQMISEWIMSGYTLFAYFCNARYIYSSLEALILKSDYQDLLNLLPDTTILFSRISYVNNYTK